MTDLTTRAWAHIDTTALQKNLAQVRALCPESHIIPVIKANAYGHGMKAIARVLSQSYIQPAALAVATMAEALRLRQSEPNLPILVLNGFTNEDELTLCQEKNLEPVVHSRYQADLLEQSFTHEIFSEKRKFWLKQNTGMNRLGLETQDCFDVYQNLHKFPYVEIILMSHLACSDDPENPDAKAFTQKQMATFESLRQRLAAEQSATLECSLAASAGIFTEAASHYDYVRPGIMLYGSSPLTVQTGEELGLLPVMTLSARLLAINSVEAGESIGYGASFTCERPTRVGVVSIGYGDGYPRSAATGTPVLVKGREGGGWRTQLIGRVSMDTLTIDLTDFPAAGVGDEVVLWGAGLCADEVARAADTIAYELFCRLTPRVPRIYN